MTSEILQLDVEDTRKQRVASGTIDLLYFYKTGMDRPRDIATKIHFIIETYCTLTYPGFFGSEDTLSSIIEKIRNTGEQHPACALLDERDDIHAYSKDYLRGDDPAGDAEVLDIKELTGFVRRTLKMVNAIPNRSAGCYGSARSRGRSRCATGFREDFGVIDHEFQRQQSGWQYDQQRQDYDRENQRLIPSRRN